MKAYVIAAETIKDEAMFGEYRGNVGLVSFVLSSRSLAPKGLPHQLCKDESWPADGRIT